MPGGLIQLAAKGDEDAFFTTPADFALFRGTFRKAANFAIEPIKLAFQQDVAFGNTCSVTIDKLGDVLTGVTMSVTIRKQAGDFTAGYHPVEALFEEISLWIDGDLIERHTSDWFRLYHTLHVPYDKAEQYNRMTNFDPDVISSGEPATQTFLLPLIFTFCRHTSCALPLVAMQFSEVVVRFKLASAATVGLDPSVLDVQFYGHFAHLDAPERQLLVTRPYDCVVEQVQTQYVTLPDTIPSSTGVSNFQAKLNFYRPVKCLYWFLKDEHSTYHGRYVGDPDSVPLAYTAHVGAPSGLCLVTPISDRLSPMISAKVTFSDQDRTPTLPFEYFNRLATYQSCIGQPVPGVSLMPFGLHLEGVAAIGVCNFSRIPEAKLELAIKQNVTSDQAVSATAAKNINFLKKLVVMAWGFNVLRIENGRATIRFR